MQGPHLVLAREVQYKISLKESRLGDGTQLMSLMKITNDCLFVHVMDSIANIT